MSSSIKPLAGTFCYLHLSIPKPRAIKLEVYHFQLQTASSIYSKYDHFPCTPCCEKRLGNPILSDIFLLLTYKSVSVPILTISVSENERSWSRSVSVFAFNRYPVIFPINYSLPLQFLILDWLYPCNLKHAQVSSILKFKISLGPHFPLECYTRSSWSNQNLHSWFHFIILFLSALSHHTTEIVLKIRLSPTSLLLDLMDTFQIFILLDFVGLYLILNHSQLPESLFPWHCFSWFLS